MGDIEYFYTLISLGSCVIQDNMSSISKWKHFMINTPHRDALLLLQRGFVIESPFLQEDEFGTLAYSTALSSECTVHKRLIYPLGIFMNQKQCSLSPASVTTVNWTRHSTFCWSRTYFSEITFLYAFIILKKREEWGLHVSFMLSSVRYSVSYYSKNTTLLRLEPGIIFTSSGNKIRIKTRCQFPEEFITNASCIYIV